MGYMPEYGQVRTQKIVVDYYRQRYGSPAVKASIHIRSAVFHESVATLP